MTSVPLASPISSILQALQLWCFCHQDSLDLTFTLWTKQHLYLLPVIALNALPIWCLPAAFSALPWVHHSATHSTSKWPPCHSSNPVGNISWLFWTQFIQYRLCSCLDNSSSSPTLHLTTTCCSWMFHAQMTLFLRWLCSWGACRTCQEAASRYFASPLALFLRFLMCLPWGRRLQLRKSALFLYSVQLHVTSLWCSFLLLWAWTAIRYHSSNSGFDDLGAWFWLLSVAQVPALAISLLPSGATLLNKTSVSALLHCVKVTQFSDTSLTKK